MTRKVNWWQAFAEVGILVAGVALALAADAWADRRAERAEERSYLLALRADFETTDSIFRYRLAGQNAQINHNKELIQLLSQPVGAVPVDSLDGLVRRAFLWTPFVPVLATYEDMVNSGDLRLIRSSDLREGMAEFVSYMEGIAPYNEGALDQWTHQVTPFMIRNLNVTEIYGPSSDISEAGFDSLPGYEWGPPIERIESLEQAYWSREFANLVAVRTIGLGDTARFVSGGLDQVATILALIERELSTR